MDVCVTIPAYNEEETVGTVVRECREILSQHGYEHEVLVIDDGSTDNTAAVAEDAGAIVIAHHTNKGLGRTFATGLRNALETDADIIVNIDADGQYRTADMPGLVETVANGEADMALGVRSVFSLDHMPTSKKVGNKIGSIVTSMLSGKRITDAQSGFRAMSRELVCRLNLFGRYTYVQESIIQTAYKGFTIKQVPIEFYARESGDSRLIGSLRNYTRNAASIVIRTYRDYRPMQTFSLIALIFFLLATIPGYQALAQFLQTGEFDLVGRGLLVVLLFVAGGITLVVGLLADMLKSQRELQEEILYELRTRE